MLTRSLICLIIILNRNCSSKRTWEYEPISVATYSSDESKLKVDAQIDRVRRGEFTFSATIDWRYDVDDTTMIEGTAYRSSTGDESDYKLLPWSIPKQKFYDYLNTYYKDVIMKSVGACSNLPQFEGKFEPPWPKKIYKLNKCVSQGDGLPEVAPPGFYKIIIAHSGQVEWSFTIIAKITTKLT